jgi:signal transduction histidine kinase
MNMKEAAYFMRDTLNYVLSMQKIEEGKLELEMVPFSMPSVISKVVATFQGGVTSKKISLDIDISPFYPKNPIVGDKHRIEHVISNLLSNAIKFSPHGSKIRIAVTCVANASTSTLLPITVEVTDQGCGIEEQDQAKLFNNFVQVSL